MLHTLFFLLSFMTDCPAVAEAMHSWSRLGLVNAGVLCGIGLGVGLRKWFASRRINGWRRAAA